jgi:hypothetical protein
LRPPLLLLLLLLRCHPADDIITVTDEGLTGLFCFMQLH